MSRPLLSIIIPVYNTEQYFLGRALKAILSQQVKDYEVIIVDDCSTDGTFSIAEQYSNEHEHISCYQLNENLGPGGARNRGIKESTGEYLFLHDADDWLENGALKRVYQHLETSQYPAMLITSFNSINQAGQKLSYLKQTEYLPDMLSGRELFKEICHDNFSTVTWNKFIRRDLIKKNQIEFPVHNFHEDMATTPFIAYCASSITVLKEPIYNYTYNPKGISKTLSDLHICSPFRAIEKLSSYFAIDDYWDVEPLLFKRACISLNWLFNTRRTLFSSGQILLFVKELQDFQYRFNASTERFLLNPSGKKLIEGLGDLAPEF